MDIASEDHACMLQCQYEKGMSNHSEELTLCMWTTALPNLKSDLIEMTLLNKARKLT